ncbi:adhesin transport system outer membrane protein [Xanthomonas sacchari]|uniref:TolC family protein n=1 Tax=Xanthomonas sacchari TaxID=56458 RepID=UPI002786C19C|nr:TolC family protein [Xanthomonas sacchari]MDQ1093616.1 adhesin transport system outer membrane protein [Xanthomonas sacchari]
MAKKGAGDRRTRRSALALAVGLWLALPACACAMSLTQAVQRGLAIEPQLRAAMADAARAATDVRIARSGYYPALSVAAGPKALDPGEVVYDVNLSQMLYDWGRVSSRVANARAQQRGQDAAVEVAADDAALQIVEVYLDVLAAQQRLQVVQAHLQRLQVIADLSEARSGGYADRSELERTRLELARGQDQLATEQGALQEVRNQFLLLVGAEAEDLVEPETLELPQLAPPLLAQAVDASPLLRKAGEQVRAAEAELREARAALKPQLNLEAAALRRDVGGRLQNDSTISLRLSMDVFQGMSTFLRPQAARQRLEAAQWNMQAMRREVLRTVQTLADSGEALRGREQALLRQAQQAVEVAELYREQMSVGRREVIELLNVQRERLEAERQLISLRIERKRLRYRAAAQIGALHALFQETTHAG